MQNLQSVTKGILKRVEEITGKSIQFMRDDNLAVLSTLQVAPHFMSHVVVWMIRCHRSCAESFAFRREVNVKAVLA